MFLCFVLQPLIRIISENITNKTKDIANFETMIQLDYWSSQI